MIEFLHEHGGQLMSKTLEHFYISIVALLLAIIVAVPIGIYYQNKANCQYCINCGGCLTNYSNNSCTCYYDTDFWCW